MIEGSCIAAGCVGVTTDAPTRRPRAIAHGAGATIASGVPHRRASRHRCASGEMARSHCNLVDQVGRWGARMGSAACTWWIRRQAPF